MQRFFFDLRDGGNDPDETGTELQDEQAAQREAIRFAGEVLRSEPHRLGDGEMRVDVREEGDGVHFAVVIRLEK
jgi:hypothetical protein